MFVADQIRGLEFVATALGGNIANHRIEIDQKQSRPKAAANSGCVIFFICFWAKAQHFGYVRQGIRCLGFITTIAVSNFTYLPLPVFSVFLLSEPQQQAFGSSSLPRIIT